MFAAPIKGVRTYGKVSVAFGTVINLMIEPMQKAYTTIMDLWYTAAGTAHVLTIMRVLGKAITTAAAASGQAVIAINRDPGKYASNIGTINTANNLIAAGDYVVYKCTDGTYIMDTVASVSTLNITMTTNVPTSGVSAGAPFWWFGITGDINPQNNAAHPTFNAPANGTTKFGSDMGDGSHGFMNTIKGFDFSGMLDTNVATYLTGQDEPMIVQSNNITATGTIEKATVCYPEFYK